MDDQPEVQRDVILALDIGRSGFTGGLVTTRGELLDRSSVQLEPDVGPQSHFASLAAVVSEQLERAKQHHVDVRAIGIGCDGSISRNCETVSPAGVSSWRNFELRRHVADLTRLPTFGDLGIRALTLAEGWLGAANGARNYCVMTVSAEVVGCLVIDGEPLVGASYNAGRIGHVIVEPGGRRCVCGARGCLESEVSLPALESITGRSLSEPTYDIMRRTGRLVGRAAGMVCASMDLDLVVVGGDVAVGFAATFLNAAQEELDVVARVNNGSAPRITPTRLDDRGPLIGAGAVAIRGTRRSQNQPASRR